MVHSQFFCINHNRKHPLRGHSLSLLVKPVKPLPDPISSLLLYTYLPVLFFPLSVLQHQRKQEDHPIHKWQQV